MECNVGTADRSVRILLGIVLLVAVYLTNTYTTILGLVGILFGVIFLVTGATKFCPLYRITGMNTCKSK